MSTAAGAGEILHKGICSTVHLVNGKVVKAYHKELLQPRHRLNISREVAILQTLKKLGVPGVVDLCHTCEDAANIYLVFQPCQHDLYQRLAQHGLFNEDDLAAQVVVPLLRVLHRLHQHGIVHRDVKPENIFFAGGEAAGLVLGDFGLAVELQDRPVSCVGTLEYMAAEVLAQPSPETLALRRLHGQRLPQAAYGTKVDIWAVGVLVQEALTGATPFATGTAHPELVSLKAQFKQPAPLGPGVSAAVADFVSLALRKVAAERPSAQELLSHPWLAPHLSPADLEELGQPPARLCKGTLPASGAISNLEASGSRPGVLLPMRPVVVRPVPLAVCCSWSPPTAVGSPDDDRPSLAESLCRAGSGPPKASQAQKPVAAHQFRSPLHVAAAQAAATAGVCGSSCRSVLAPGGAAGAAVGHSIRGSQVLLQEAGSDRGMPRVIGQVNMDALCNSSGVPLYVAAGQVPVLLLCPSHASSSKKPHPFMAAGRQAGAAAVSPCFISGACGSLNQSSAASTPPITAGLAATAVLVTETLARRGLWVKVPTVLAASQLPALAS